MAKVDVLNAAPLKRVPSRSPHPPKTDRFSKVDQLRKQEPEVTTANVVTGNTVSDRFAGDTGASATARINPTTNQREITGVIPFIDSETITKIFTAGEESAPIQGKRVAFNQTLNPQADTSGEKSASNTAPYFGGSGG
jgi:hypothetical protein